MISVCPSCKFATDDELWFRAHQVTHAVSRPHDVSGMSRQELARARRELRASLGLMRPGSPASVPVLARLAAVMTEMVSRGLLR